MLFFNKKNKMIKWEILLIERILSKINSEKFALEQLNSGLIKGVRPIHSRDEFVNFVHESSLIEKYLDENSPSYHLEGVEVFNKATSEFIPFRIHKALGLLSGYSTPGHRIIKLNIDVGQIKIQTPIRKYAYSTDDIYSKVPERLLKKSELYKVEIESVNYYHLKSIEDGNFVGVDSNGNYFLFLHDPFEIKPITEKDIEEIFLK